MVASVGRARHIPPPKAPETMATFLCLFKTDSAEGSAEANTNAWNAFIDRLRKKGHFVGGGPLGEGCVRKRDSTIAEISSQFGGYMVVNADSLKTATSLLDDCPTILGGGSVEVRHVPEV